MSDNAVFKAMFSNFRVLKTSDEVKLEFVIPRHEAKAVLDMLGIPNPANPVWCGIALLKEGA